MTSRCSLDDVRLARRRAAQRGFSLIELMIAIVILGLGLVMVGTMFPVAWDRARTLTEQSTSDTIAPQAHEVVRQVIQVADADFRTAMLAGDLVLSLPSQANGASIAGVVALPDNRVHALNMENMQVVGNMPFVAENPWEQELYPPLETGPSGYLWNAGFTPVPAFFNQTFHSPRIAFHQRLYPPMPARAARNLSTPDRRWHEALDTRKFSWAVLYRIRDFVNENQLGNLVPPPQDPAPFDDNPMHWLSADTVAQARVAISQARSLDLYYVVLRRPSSTNRYARQGTPSQDVFSSVPDPWIIEDPVISANPTPLPANQDVRFPVPWRVQIQFPRRSVVRQSYATGVPTEVVVPPMTGNQPGPAIPVPNAQLVAGMFPPGAQFIDEVNGEVYRVVKRRFITEQNSQAVLTLDREVVAEDLDFPQLFPACDTCQPLDPNAPVANYLDNLDNEELVRAVWVFPPPVGQPQTIGAVLPRIFDGPQPVISIQIRSLTITPTVPAA